MAIIIKNADQIEGIRKACKLTAEILTWIEPQIVPGISTLEINDRIEKFTQERGARSGPLGYKNFPKSICTSINEVVCHGIPDNTILKEGDIINVDVSPVLNGFYGDASKTFAVGPISADAQRLIDITKRCLEIGIEQVKPGNRIGQIGYEIAKYAHAQNCTIVECFGGHGVGIEFHEEPFVPHNAQKHEGPVMKPGMIFTIEPMINLGSHRVVVEGWIASTADKQLSAQFEHTVLVTDTSVEILTE